MVWNRRADRWWWASGLLGGRANGSAEGLSHTGAACNRWPSGATAPGPEAVLTTPRKAGILPFVTRESSASPPGVAPTERTKKQPETAMTTPPGVGYSALHQREE